MESQLNNQEKSDISAFEALYDEFAPRIYRYHYYRTFHVETAEDLTSQTFLRALEHYSAFDPAKGSFSAWIYRIARNLLIDQIRAAKPVADIEDYADILHDGKKLNRTLEQKEQLEQAIAHLEKLTSEQREIITLRLWDELSYAEIALVTGKSEGACKMTVSRVLKDIRIAIPVAVLLLILNLK